MENNEIRYTDKYRLDANWLNKQWSRPDGEERVAAFYESIRDALISDGECRVNNGENVFRALAENDTSQLLIALCGWGPKNLAKRARLLRGRAQYQEDKFPGVLVVHWSDQQRTHCECTIQSEDHMISNLDYGVFVRWDGSTATIQNVFVRFAPFDGDNQYHFQCVSQAERDAAGDDEIFWYPPEEDLN